jgi:hypothetical protein
LLTLFLLNEFPLKTQGFARHNHTGQRNKKERCMDIDTPSQEEGTAKKIAKMSRRSESATRQTAFSMGFSLDRRA